MKNLRAADTAELAHKGESRTIVTSEVPVGERAAILDLYQEQVGRAVVSHLSAELVHRVRTTTGRRVRRRG